MPLEELKEFAVLFKVVLCWKALIFPLQGLQHIHLQYLGSQGNSIKQFNFSEFSGVVPTMDLASWL